MMFIFDGNHFQILVFCFGPIECFVKEKAGPEIVWKRWPTYIKTADYRHVQQLPSGRLATTLLKQTVSARAQHVVRICFHRMCQTRSIMLLQLVFTANGLTKGSKIIKRKNVRSTSSMIWHALASGMTNLLLSLLILFFVGGRSLDLSQHYQSSSLFLWCFPYQQYPRPQ